MSSRASDLSTPADRSRPTAEAQHGACPSSPPDRADRGGGRRARKSPSCRGTGRAALIARTHDFICPGRRFKWVASTAFGRRRARARIGCGSATARPLNGHNSATVRPHFGYDSTTVRSQFGHISATVRPLFGYDSTTVRSQLGHSSATVRPRFGHRSNTGRPVSSLSSCIV